MDNQIFLEILLKSAGITLAVFLFSCALRLYRDYLLCKIEDEQTREQAREHTREKHRKTLFRKKQLKRTELNTAIDLALVEAYYAAEAELKNSNNS